MNILFITADEMRGDCTAYAGNRDIRTPSLDAFSRRAVWSSRHFTVHGKCVPSRIAMMTGRYSHTDGIRSINEENHLPAGMPCLLSSLKAAGYESAVFGHNHVWADFWGTNHKSSSIVDYHSYTEEGGFRALLDRVWTPPAPPPGAPTPMTLPHGWDYRGRVSEQREFCDDNRIEQAIHFLRTVRDRTRPFYLHLNIGLPHPPYAIEEPWYSLYDRTAIHGWPRSLPTNAPLPLRAMRRIRSGDAENPAACAEIQAVYYGMVSKVDALVGRLLEAVDTLGLFKDTVVVFTADHGDFASQYQLIEKWDTALNDCILKVPLIVAIPGQAPRRVDGLSEHVDLAPTLLDVAGIAPLPGWNMHGSSLRQALGGGIGKPAVFADGGHEFSARQRFMGMRSDPHTGKHVPVEDGKQRTYLDVPDAMARAKMVRTERWKLVVRETGGDELYDLAADPWELANVHGRTDLAHVTSDLQGQLLRWCLRTDPDGPHLARLSPPDQHGTMPDQRRAPHRACARLRHGRRPMRLDLLTGTSADARL